MLSDGTGVRVDIVVRSVTLTSVVCSDSGWVMDGEDNIDKNTIPNTTMTILQSKHSITLIAILLETHTNEVD